MCLGFECRCSSGQVTHVNGTCQLSVREECETEAVQIHKNYPPFVRSGWGHPGFKLRGGSPKDHPKEDCDPYNFEEIDAEIEVYNINKKFCKEIVKEMANKVIDIVSEVKLNMIFNSVLTDEQVKQVPVVNPATSEEKEKKLKRIFENVMDDVYDKEREVKKGKKSLKEIFAVVVGEKMDSNDNAPVNLLYQNKAGVCSKNCPTSLCCYTQQNIIDKIKVKLSSMRSTERHNFLLERLAAQCELGIDSLNIFVVEKTAFCHDSFKAFFGISDYLVRKVLLEHQSGSTRFIHGNQGNLYDSPDRDRTIAFISKFAEVFSENLPDRSCLRLPSYLNIKCIFDYYCE